MNYYGLHYHMKSSGVKFVMDNIQDSLKRYSKDVKIYLIYSDKGAKYENKDITIINNPLVDYDDRMFSSKEELDNHVIKVKDSIKSQLDLSKSCVIHTHNVNLMKNTCLGRALQFLADELKDKVLLIMQVHDFAEDNRPELLEKMQNAIGKLNKEFANKLAYPIANNIIYCTINSRDKKLLEKINIPKERIFLFPDNIDAESLELEPKNTGLKEKIAEYAENNGYVFDEKRKILLSPLKVIQRKNVIETLLLLKLFNSIKDELQLLITLDAHSKEDIKYSELIKDYVKKNKLPVTIGFGYELISPTKERSNEFQYNMADLFSIADFIITTSKLEGFGMSYLEAWVANKAVIGRRIDFIFKDFEKNNIDMSHFYDKLIIDNKDFKDYTPEEQIKLLDKADLNELLSQKQIKNLVDFLDKDNSALIKKNKENILKNYSLKAYHALLMNMIKKGFELIKKKEKFNIDNSFLIDYFKK